MHVFGAPVELLCLFFHFILVVITLVNHVVFFRHGGAAVSMVTAHLAFSIISIIVYGACAAPLFVYAYKYGKTHARRTSRLQAGIAIMFAVSNLPFTIIELIYNLDRGFVFQYPLDGIVFILHAMATIFGGSISWLGYMKAVAIQYHRLRGPERQIDDDFDNTPARLAQVRLATPVAGAPAVI